MRRARAGDQPGGAMSTRARLTLLAAVLVGTASAAEQVGSNSTKGDSIQGVANVVPPGYTEVCAIRADLKDKAVAENGVYPSPYAILYYGGRMYKTPTQDVTLAPVWQMSGCNTFPTPTVDDSLLTLRIEIWDDRTRAYDPLSVVYKDVDIGSLSTSAATTIQRWADLDDKTSGRVFVSVTVSPANSDGSIADSPNKFKTLTSTPAFFVYVGAATFTIIVCVCCIWGKGVAPPPRTHPPPPPKVKPSKSMGADQPLVPSQDASLMHASSRPQLTIEVATPPGVRDGAAGAEGEAMPPAEAPQPAAEPVKTAPARWPATFFNFG